MSFFAPKTPPAEVKGFINRKKSDAHGLNIYIILYFIFVYYYFILVYHFNILFTLIAFSFIAV